MSDAQIQQTKERPHLRPSMLPKLALCSWYRSEENAGAAADRGTKLDVAFRAVIAGAALPAGLTAEESANVRWAVDTARALAGGAELVSVEEELKIEALGLTGTADLLCPEHNWSADLKTGQRRNYLEQQACYALGFMDRQFVDEWTVYLIYCDLQEMERLHFTRDEAERLVRGVLAKEADPQSLPQVNDYCGWCALRFDCEARKERLGLIPLSELEVFDQAPSEILRDFVLRANIVEEFAAKAKEVLKERLVAGDKVAGVSLVSKRGARKVPERVIELHLKSLGVGDILAAYGPLSEAKLLEIWERKLPDTPFPKDQVQEVPGSSYVRVSHPKAKALQ